MQEYACFKAPAGKENKSPGSDSAAQQSELVVLAALPACVRVCSTFWLTAAMGQAMRLNFTGTPSKVLRVRLPYADPTAELVLAINMQQTPNRRFAWSETRRRIDPLPQPPVIGDSSAHGDLFWDQDTTLFTLKLKGGGGSIEIRSENAIAVTQRLAVSINDFYDTQSRFLANLVRTWWCQCVLATS